MQFVYKPEGADPVKWEFDPAKLMSPEVETIERHTGLPYGEWLDAVGRGSFTAVHGLLFVLLKRRDPALKWEHVQFCMADIDFEMTQDELNQARWELEDLAKEGPLSDTDAKALRDLVQSGAEARDETPALAPVPKEKSGKKDAPPTNSGG